MKLRTSNKILCWQGVWEIETHTLRMYLAQPPWRTIWQYQFNLQMPISFNPEIPLLEIYSFNEN